MAHFGMIGMKQNIITKMNQKFYGKLFSSHQEHIQKMG
jgi:hypothetical protein